MNYTIGNVIKGLFATALISFGLIGMYSTLVSSLSWMINFGGTLTSLVIFASFLLSGSWILIGGRNKLLRKVFYISGLNFQAWKFKLPQVDVQFNMPVIFGRTFPTPNIALPKWAGVRVKGGMWKVATLATGLGLVATLGIFFATTRQLEGTPTWPQAAAYDAGTAYELDRKKLHVGTKHSFANDTPAKQRHTQTLKIIVGGARMSELNFDTISLGKATGLSEGLQITGDATKTLQCDEIIIDGLEAPKFYLANSSIHELVVVDNATDGSSISPTLATVSDIEVGSTRGALTIPAASDSTYDRIIIDSTGGDSICETLILKDIKLFGTYSGNSVDLQFIDAGKLTIQNSIIGDGTGIDVASFTIDTTTSVSSATLTGNVERPISIK